MTGKLTYAGAGVDIEAGDALVRAIAPLARATARPGVMGGVGGFAALFDPAACGYDDPLLVASTDGVGTKLMIGIETGMVDGLGQDLVAMCVNDLLCQGAEPLFFLDYFATGKLDPGIAERVIASIAAACRAAGCALIGGETAEMPQMYASGHFDLAGFVVGMVERDAVLPRLEAVRPGDVVIGLAASGPHSNGYSLIRRLVAAEGLGWHDEAPWGGGTVAGTLLTPTRLYGAECRALAGGGLRGFANITGGGLPGNLNRALPEGVDAVLDGAAWPRGAFFDWVGARGLVEPAEMLRAFNCGIGLCAVVSPELAQALPDIGAAWRIGEIIAAPGPARVLVS